MCKTYICLNLIYSGNHSTLHVHTWVHLPCLYLFISLAIFSIGVLQKPHAERSPEIKASEISGWTLLVRRNFKVLLELCGDNQYFLSPTV